MRGVAKGIIDLGVDIYFNDDIILTDVINETTF